MVGMQYAISVDAATRFSNGFYDALWEGKSIDEAVFAARERLWGKIPEAELKNSKPIELQDFGLPVIYSRLPRTVSLALQDIPAAPPPAPQPDTAEGLPEPAR